MVLYSFVSFFGGCN